ncbi:Hypothetical predicted protein [Olea europaea subsp. europaea]|uniref:Uncharacterized protein n=1 Tax=Olea europaea subsp. europaea TaxID=158383 RepID=A0A8S0S7Y8_OLEEU|nr:Hypothetical predicted protein [Olea europaea subsp. europaea]
MSSHDGPGRETAGREGIIITMHGHGQLMPGHFGSNSWTKGQWYHVMAVLYEHLPPLGWGIISTAHQGHWPNPYH